MTPSELKKKKAGMIPQGMLVTDFDGTLRRTEGGFSSADLATLEQLGRDGFVRVIATGRNLFSFNRAVDGPLPVDYLVFSSGAGVIELSDGRLIRDVNLSPGEVTRAAVLLLELGLDFMIHKPIPDNHHFAYHGSGTPNPDFHRRIAIYREYARPLEHPVRSFGPAAQLLAVAPPGDGVSAFDAIRARLSDFTVIRATSPLDHQSVWIEIFARNVSKGHTTAWLAGRLGISRSRVMSVGNDYNDLDILKWTPESFVVANAPAELRSVYRTVASNDEGGVSEAVRIWRDKGRSEPSEPFE